MRFEAIEGRVAIVTGANHGIGAATAEALAGHGARVLLSYLRVRDLAAEGAREAYRVNRAQDSARVVRSIRDAGGQAETFEADLRDPATPAKLFDAAEVALGSVEILVNNATGWRPDTFKPVELAVGRERELRAIESRLAKGHAAHHPVGTGRGSVTVGDLSPARMPGGPDHEVPRACRLRARGGLMPEIVDAVSAPPADPNHPGTDASLSADEPRRASA